MIRAIGEGAHILDVDVEQMARIAGRIGNPAANGAARFDQRDIGLRCIEAARDVNRRQRACRPTPYNRNSNWRRRAPPGLVLNPRA
jgi:hypothetical protein